MDTTLNDDNTYVCTLEWNILGLAQWQAEFARLPCSNLLQSYDYAVAMAPLYGQKPRWGVIEIDGQPAALMQVMEAKTLGGALHAVMLDRGPLWFEGYGSEEHWQAFAYCFSREFPARFGRRRRWLPEAGADSGLGQKLVELGWRLSDKPAYQTLWLDLQQSEDALLSGMRKSWRQSLRKAQGADLELIWDDSGKMLPVLLKAYADDRLRKRYPGPDLRAVRALGLQFAKSGALRLGFTRRGNEILAGVMILCHGQSATYQVGYSLENGRKFCAHHLLLWEATRLLKQQEFKSFDLGGVNDGSAENVKRFKNGLGGDGLSLCGLYL